MALVAMFISSCNSAEIDNSTVKSVDLNRYLGSWYEIAKYDHVFERGLDYAMANYTLRDRIHRYLSLLPPTNTYW